MGRLRKKFAGKAREFRGMRRTLVYAAMTRDEAQRHLKVVNSIRIFYEAVKSDAPAAVVRWRLCQEEVPSGENPIRISRLLKNAHLLRCASNLIAQRISIYALLFGFCTPCI